jgi:hypothetical protein
MASASPSTKSFDGDYVWEDSPSSRTFSLWLKSVDSKLIGQYCAAAEHGKKINCDDENSPNIEGTFDKFLGIGELEFSSFFGAMKRIASITINKKINLAYYQKPRTGRLLCTK